MTNIEGMTRIGEKEKGRPTRGEPVPLSAVFEPCTLQSDSLTLKLFTLGCCFISLCLGFLLCKNGDEKQNLLH